MRSRSRLDLLLHVSRESEPGQRLDRLANPILDLDEILAAIAVARLQLEVAGDDPVPSGLHRGEACEALGHRRDRDSRATPAVRPVCGPQKKTGSR